MKIGFLVDKVSFGGGERILKMLIDEFYKLGHTISIYSWNNDWFSFNNVNGYSVFILHDSPIGLRKKFLAYKELKDIMLVTRPDCLIIFSLGLAEIGVWAAKHTGIPVVLSERVDPRYLPKSRIHRFLRLLVYRACNGIVFQTIEVQNYYSKTIQKRGIVIPNPIMDDKLPTVNVRNSKKEIVAVGRLSHEKNYELLITAFSELNLSEYKLRIFGEGPLFCKLSRMIEAFGMQDRIFLEGQVDRVVDQIKNSDIFVLSSKYEGMPNVLIEAMSMGLACVSTDFSSGGARALIVHGENGMIVPTNNIEAMKNVILELVNDATLKQKMKINALKIRKTNSKERILPLWIDFIYSISNSKV